MTNKKSFSAPVGMGLFFPVSGGGGAGLGAVAPTIHPRGGRELNKSALRKVI